MPFLRVIFDVMLEINEPIEVSVLFKSNFIQPACFWWRSREIKVDQINLVHATKFSSSVFYHFSISAENNFYQLKFDVANMKWILEAVEDG